jgi:hypothetical protein
MKTQPIVEDYKKGTANKEIKIKRPSQNRSQNEYFTRLAYQYNEIIESPDNFTQKINKVKIKNKVMFTPIILNKRKRSKNRLSQTEMT